MKVNVEKKRVPFCSLSVFVNLSHGIVGKPQRQKARNSSSLLIITGQAAEGGSSREGGAVSRRATLRHISSQRCDPLFVWCAPLTSWESKAGSERKREKERRKERRGKGEWKWGKQTCQRPQSKYVLYYIVALLLPALLRVCFFVCGKVNPWASISRNNLSNIKTFNTTNDNGPATQSTQSSRATSFNLLPMRSKLFYCPCPQFLCHELCRSCCDLWTSLPSYLPPLPPPTSSLAVSSGHYAVYWVPHLSARTAGCLAESEAAPSQSRNGFPCPGHIVQQIGGRQRLHMGFTFSILCLYWQRIVVALTCLPDCEWCKAIVTATTAVRICSFVVLKTMNISGHTTKALSRLLIA